MTEHLQSMVKFEEDAETAYRLWKKDKDDDDKHFWIIYATILEQKIINAEKLRKAA